MAFTEAKRLLLEEYFKTALVQYKHNLILHKDTCIDANLLINIEIEVLNNTIWNNIKEATFQYIEALESEADVTTEGLLPKFHAKVLQTKEEATVKFASAITELIRKCGIKFTDPTKDYYFWGADPGEAAANRQGDFGRTANIVAPASKDLFRILLGPLSIDDPDLANGVIGFEFHQEAATGPRYALQSLLYPVAARPAVPNLPDCSRLLWAAMSKVFADNTIEAITNAKKMGKRAPKICVFLPERIETHRNYWLWELPQIAQTGVEISYKKKSGDMWLDTTIQDYPLSTEGEPKITVKKLAKIAQKWKAFSENKDKQQPLPIILNVLQNKSSAEKSSRAYHKSAQKSERDAAHLDHVENKLNIAWTNSKTLNHGLITIRMELLKTYYKVDKVPLRRPEDKRTPSLNNTSNILGFRFGEKTLDLKKIPSTLGGQLRLMQIAKNFHQYQIIIDLYRQSELTSLRQSIQGKELVIWALNRRAEILLRAPKKQIREAAKVDLKISEIIENEIQRKRFESGSTPSKAALFEKARRIGLLLEATAPPEEQEDSTINTILEIYKNNLFDYADPASGAKYLQEIGAFFNKHKRLPAHITLDILRDVAERAYNSVLLTGIEECVETALLRTALLAAITLNDSTKINRIKLQMKKTPMHLNELGYMQSMVLCQLPARGDTNSEINLINMELYHDFSDIIASQLKQEFKRSTIPLADPNKKFWLSSYDYRQSLATYYGGMVRGGNLQYGGALPKQLVTNSDISIFEKLLDEPISKLVPTKEFLEEAIARIPASNQVAKTFFNRAKHYFYEQNQAETLRERQLASFEDPSEVLEIMRYIVALNFQSLADASDPDKASYRQLDYAMNAMNRLMIDQESRQQKHFDSATSISIMYGLQVGDCRHHAESMQLFFDTWKYRRLETALNRKDMGYFHALSNQQLRVIDTQEETLDKTTNEKKFTYAHTFNVLQEIDSTGQPRHTIFDAFDLSLDGPQSVTMQMEGDALILNAQKIEIGTGRAYVTRYKFTPYAGDKGATKATGQDLSMLGRSGITEDSVYRSIVNSSERARTQASVTKLARTEKERFRQEIDLRSLFEMMVIKGYTFDDSTKVKEDEKLTHLINEYTTAMGYPAQGGKYDATHLINFYREIQNRPDLYQELRQLHIKNEMNNRFKKLFNILLTSKEFTQTNSSGIKQIRATLRDPSKTLVEKLLIMQQIGMKRTKPGFSYWYSHSHFFGKGRAEKVDTIYRLFAKIQIAGNDISTKISPILDQLEEQLIVARPIIPPPHHQLNLSRAVAK